MRIDVHPVARMRGTTPLNVPGALAPLLDALGATSVDLRRVRVVCDWIQYRSNFAEPVACRPVLAEHTAGHRSPAAGQQPAEGALEVALDLRRLTEAEVTAGAVKEALAAYAGPAAGSGPSGAEGQAVPPGQEGREGQECAGRIMLEPWLPATGSCIWRFNTLYWQALSRWEQVTGREYEQALPGGQSDARQSDPVRELILELFRVWDELDARHALPEELYVVELGVGNGNQAATWLDEFAELDRAHGRDYYRRLHYLMGDYSAHVLDRARQAVARHGDTVSTLVLEATRPQLTLGFLRGKAFCVYISNVYDNLPSDEVAVIRGRIHLVQTRSFLGGAAADKIAATFGIRRAEITPLTERLLRIGPELLSESVPEKFPDTERAVLFWQAVWAALRQHERYVPLEGLDTYHVTPSLTGEILRPLLAEGDVRMHVSNGTLSSFADTLPLLHPFGRVVCHDLFTTGSHQYRTGFYGPGKYDGSTVNWVNGPLLQLFASRRGFDVAFTEFKQRPGSNVKTLTAQVRD